MNDVLADRLDQAILDAVVHFCGAHPDEHPYALALLPSQDLTSAVYAIATEERLLRTADHYLKLGWRLKRRAGDLDVRTLFATWLRWGNPDDGWAFGDFDAGFRLGDAMRDADWGHDPDERTTVYEDWVIERLGKLLTTRAWRSHPVARGLIVGVTDGEVPHNFIRTATRANPYPAVVRLWGEWTYGEEVGTRVRPPKYE